MELVSNPAVAQVFDGYPKNARSAVLKLRKLVIKSAREAEGVETLEETLKWNEPAYISNIGSSIRMAWNPARPEQYALYFICNTKLVDTFAEIYGDTFIYSGNRALEFQLGQPLPEPELAHCCSLALRYHSIKHLPLLGA